MHSPKSRESIILVGNADENTYFFSYTFIKYSGNSNVNSMYNHNIYKISLVIKFSAHFQYTDFHEFQHVNVLFNT